MYKDIKPAPLSGIRQELRGLGEYLQRRSGNSHLPKADSGAWQERRNLEKYNKILPTFLNKSFLEIARELPTDSRVLDYGCGDAAIALTELKNKLQRITCEGVTYPIGRHRLPKIQSNISVFREDGDTFLALNPARYSIIFSVGTIRYSVDHFLTLKRAYRALAPGGILLVDIVLNMSRPMVDSTGKRIPIDKLTQALKKAGYKVEIKEIEENNGFSFAIQRNHPSLKLPLKLVTHPELKKRPILREEPFDFVGMDKPNNPTYVYMFCP